MLTQGFKNSFTSAAKDPKTGKRGDPRWDEHDAKITAALKLPAGPPPPPSTLVWDSRHDVLDTVARRHHTTYEVLLCLNGAERASDLKNGQALKFYEAKHGSYVTGFSAFTAANAAVLYNGGGDPNYAEKLTYVMGLI